jgi:hypothetical protein
VICNHINLIVRLKKEKRASQAPTSADDLKDKYIKKLEEEVRQLKEKLKEYEARFMSMLQMPPPGMHLPSYMAPPPPMDDLPPPPAYTQ